MRRLTLSLFAALFIGTAILWAIHTYLFSQFSLSSALSTERDISVSIENTIYDVQYGAVYQDGRPVDEDIAAHARQLAFERLATERSPLLALPGVDLDSLARSLDSLASTKRQLASIQVASTSASLVERLYPLNFLSAVTDLERKRRIFIASGTDTDARAYRSQLHITLNAYKADLVTFESAFRAAVPQNAPPYATASDLITRSDTLRVLSALQRGIDTTAAEIARRENCFIGDGAACRTSDIALPKLAPTDAPSSSEGFLFAQDLRRMERQQGVSLDVSEPLYELVTSACITPQRNTGLFFSLLDASDGTQVPFYVGDVRFIPSGTYAKLPFYDYFAQHGIRYVVSLPTTYYACTNFDRDEADVISTRDVRSFSAANRISKYASGDELTRLEGLEKALSSTSIVRYQDARAYLTAALPLVQRSSLPEAVTQRLLALSLEMKYRVAGTPQAIADISRLEGQNLSLARRGIDVEFTPFSLFYTRSALPSLFMASNPSIQPIPGAIYSTLPQDEETPFVYYSSLGTTTEMRATLDSAIGTYAALHASL